MFPDEFTYHRAGSVDEALDLLADHADDETELLAGGHSLLPTMKTGLASPDVVVDIGRLDSLRGIEGDGDSLRIGALTPYADIADDDRIREASPVVAEAAAAVGDTQVRNAGTIGGNLAHADPAADMPASVLAAAAAITVQGRDGSRRIPAAEFFHGLFSTALAEGELLTEVAIPTDGPNETSTYVKRASPDSGYAMVGVGAAIETDGGAVESARVAATGATEHARRLPAVEAALQDEALTPERCGAAASRATEDFDETALLSDKRASSEFRAQLLEQYTERALGAVSERA